MDDEDGPAPGRPRAFAADAALDRAIEIFWLHGYEGTSLTELTGAMGINKPSLYAAFGNKERLFELALARYVDRDMAYVRTALALPTAREVIQNLLRDTVQAVTTPGRPAGCFTVQTGLTCRPENEHITQLLAAARRTGELALTDRLERAQRDGDLDDDADAPALASYVMMLSEGLAVHATAGETREELTKAVEMALRALPV